MNHMSGHERIGRVLATLVTVTVFGQLAFADERLPIHEAARRGDLAEVTKILGADPNLVNARDSDGMTPLHWASGLLDIVDALISHGANVNAKDIAGRSPLLCATGQRKLKVMQRLLLVPGVDINAKENNLGFSALHRAATFGFKEGVLLLLANGARTDLRDKYGQTPLAMAICNEHKTIAELLLLCGADIDARDDDGRTLLHEFARHNGPEDVDYLLDHGADINARDNNGHTPLYLAIAQGLILPEQRANEEVVRHLLARKAQVDIVTAAALGDPKLVTQLLKSNPGAVGETDKEGMTPLHMAATYGRPKCAEVLLEAKADIRAKNKLGFTPLHVALARNRTKVVDLLLTHGAEVDIWAAAALGREKHITNLVKTNPSLLKARVGGGETALHWAALFGQEGAIETLIQAGADVNAKDDMDSTPIAYASMKGRERTVALLIAHKADVMSRDNRGYTPLHMAAWLGWSKAAAVLLEHGADVNCRDLEGKTPLHLAAFWEQPGMAKVLIDHGADVNARDRNQVTPLYDAARMGRLKVAEVLLNSEADPNIRTVSGFTPVQIASMNKFPELAKLLERATKEARDRHEVKENDK